MEEGGDLVAKDVAENGERQAAEDASHDVCPLNSFRADTTVATPQGDKPIGSVKVGDHVLAYDGATGKVKSETVQQVFINHDNNLLEVTLSTETSKPATQAQDHSARKQREAEVSAHGAQAPPTTETLHTTTEHPFLTQDRGLVPALLLRPGEHVRRLDGTWGVVVALHVRSGIAVRYNLTVAQDHTFAVGADQWVVHNCGGEYKSTYPRHVTSGDQLDPDLVDRLLPYAEVSNWTDH